MNLPETFLSHARTIILLACALAQYTSVEYPDGSYSIGYDSYGEGSDTLNSGEALSAMLTKAQGWTETSLDEYGHTDTDVLSTPSSELRSMFTDAMADLLKKCQLMLRKHKNNIKIIQKVFLMLYDYCRYISKSVGVFLRNWAFGNSNNHNRWHTN